MPKLHAHASVSAMVFASAIASWVPFHSSTYPYSVSQPSSFRHIVLANTANQQVDFFFPSLGSFTTNVNILSQTGMRVPDEVAYLKGMNGHNIHRSGWVTVMGQRRSLMYANFNSLAGKYAIEQIQFTQGDRAWQLTASYEARYRSLRATMLKMLASFRTNP